MVCYIVGVGNQLGIEEFISDVIGSNSVNGASVKKFILIPAAKGISVLYRSWEYFFLAKSVAEKYLSYR